MSAFVSWGRVRRALQPLVLKYWLNQRGRHAVQTRVEGLDLNVFPSVFHPRYFGSSAILARFVSALPLKDKSFLDVGCGSGVIAITAARAGAGATAVDVNPEAVRCTQENAERNHVRIDARVSDLFASLNGTRFDVIAWNPPFLPGTARSSSEAAFYGGPDFDVIRRFAHDVRAHLQPGASIYTILSADIDVAKIENIFRRHDFTVSTALSTRWTLGETMVILCAQ
jgi:release factor glutamine methyltransferase